ncbi:MAG: xanthine dehydrogenase family protein subunit M [Burkholderiaceae bacterium]|nr:xanthine dehydrogenase family protein subunit M [Burkholderiaceae bacterium]
MKAPNFEYVRATSIEDAIAHLVRCGDGAQILAGGQSLVPMLNLRVAAPDCVIDISGIAGLDAIERRGDRIRVGALATHAALGRSPLIAEAVPLLAQAVPHVAHLAIRNVGTIGGSLALADPAAEYPAVALALDATILVRGPGGERGIAASDYFQGLYTTARAADEILVAVEFPAIGADERAHFSELSRRRGDFAMVGLAAQFRFDGDRIGAARMAFLSVGDRPILARAAMAALQGAMPDAEATRAAQAALETDLSPGDDLHADAATKMHLARVLLGRCLGAIGGTQ